MLLEEALSLGNPVWLDPVTNIRESLQTLKAADRRAAFVGEPAGGVVPLVVLRDQLLEHLGSGGRPETPVSEVGTNDYLLVNPHVEVEELELDTRPVVVRDTSGRFLGVYSPEELQHLQVVTLRDSVKTLREQVQELEVILDNSYDEIFVVDAEGRVLRVSAACERLYGVRPQELVGRNVKELEKLGYFQPSITPLTLKERRRVTITQKTKTGCEIIVTANPVFDEKGQISKLVINSRDVTELNAVRQQLEATEALVRVYCREVANLQRHRWQEMGGIVAESPAMRRTLELAQKVSQVDSTVLLLGETGVGKTLLASYIHSLSARAAKPFVVVSCGAIPETLLESEIFGYEPGAFTGASTKGKKGLVEEANGGTLFLDEIGELPLSMQVKLLHLLQERRITRLGGSKPVYVDVRIMAATNRDLSRLVAEGKFREDLYYRLNVVPIVVPPLRQRREDIRPLTEAFLGKLRERYGLNKRFSPAVWRVLENYSWPGNVRELQNLVERVAIVAPGPEVGLEDLPEYLYADSEAGTDKDRPAVQVLRVCSLREAVEAMEEQLLRKAASMYPSTYKMAEVLGVNQSTVVRKLRKYARR